MVKGEDGARLADGASGRSSLSSVFTADINALARPANEKEVALSAGLRTRF
jgi:hypothetical protein